VVLSGGQDSTTCLHWALNRYKDVSAITYDYGQKHDAEVKAAEAIAKLNGVAWGLIKVPRMAGKSPLTNVEVDLGKYDNINLLPGGIEPTFVPGRNIIFLALAANRAGARGAEAIITGLCQEDYGGYPDCRRAFVDSMERSINMGLKGSSPPIRIITPLMRLTKAESVKLAVAEGAMGSLALSHTCYDGARPPCGKCHACHLRARGFEEAGIPDPLTDV